MQKPRYVTLEQLPSAALDLVTGGNGLQTIEKLVTLYMHPSTLAPMREAAATALGKKFAALGPEDRAALPALLQRLGYPGTRR